MDKASAWQTVFHGSNPGERRLREEKVRECPGPGEGRRGEEKRSGGAGGSQERARHQKCVVARSVPGPGHQDRESDKLRCSN